MSCTACQWPGFVEVTFPVVYLDGSIPDPTNPLVYVVTKTIKQAMDSPATGHPGGKTFHDTAPAFFTNPSSADPQNEDDLDDLGLQIAQDYYNFASLGHDVVYNGIVAGSPEGISDCLEFVYDGEDISTRVSTGPINDYPEEMMHAVPLSSGSASSSSSSSSASPYYNGSLSLVSDVTCVNGLINVYKYTQNYASGLLQNTGGSAFSHTAGCCDCPSSGSATPSSSSHPVSSSTAPVSSSTAPVSSSTAPVSSSTAPVSSSTAPISSSTAPTSSASMSHVSSFGVESSAGGLGV